MHPEKDTSRNYQRWIWIELIGFDNTQPDCGAQNYFDTIGFIPEAISLLITTPDIVHHHEGLATEVEFPPDFSSYHGHTRSAERRRQIWTNHQLHRLVSSLRSRGVKLFLSTFTTKVRFYYLPQETRREWAEDHLELLEVNRNGKSDYSIAAIKRFADGSYYEDFFIPKLAQTLQDYEFDGWHAADGWGPQRQPINEADFSDDMVEQFVHFSGEGLKCELELNCDGDAAKIAARAEKIWKHERRTWIDFHTERWAAFYRKKVAALHAAGKEVVINSAWTRDPFEAIYRYGIDYRKLIDAGIDGIVTESAAGASDMEAMGGNRLFNYVAALVLIRAYLPQARLLFLHGLKDTKEQWDVIHHAPTVLENEIFSLAGVYRRTADNTLQRAADGFVGCLCDSIRADEWRWLQRRWDLAFDEQPQDLVGATLVWSDALMAREIDDFIEHRNWTTHRLLYNLNEQNAPVQAAVRIEEIGCVTGPLLLLNAHLLESIELEQLRQYRGGPVIALEREIDGDGEAFVCRVWDSSDATHVISTPVEPISNVSELREPTTFLHHLQMKELPGEFIRQCAEIIARVAGAPRVVHDEPHVQLQTTRLENGELRITLKNSRLAYSKARIDVGRAIESVEVQTEFPAVDIEPEGSEFEVKIPGRGATIVDVKLAS